MAGDERAPGIGHNRPPLERPKYELRGTGGISCDWTHPQRGESRPRRFVRYWRLYGDGKMIDSFLTKARAVRRLKQLLAAEQ